MNKRPNVLIFMTDQQRYDVTTSNHYCKTPNLDKLAEGGVRFNRVYPPMAHCCPARASFFTGVYPSQHGIHNNVLNGSSLQSTLNEGIETFSERLKEEGYSLYFSGKWHISATENPSDRGFEELCVHASKDDSMGPRMREWEKVEHKDAVERVNGQVIRPGWGSHRIYYQDDRNQTGYEILKGYEGHKDYRIVRKALDKFDEIKESKDNKPWCMYIGTVGPHAPFHIPKKYVDMYDPNEMELPPNYRDTLEDKPYYYQRVRKRWDQLTEYEIKESIAYYYGFNTMIDDMFGEVIDKLEKMGELDNTIIIFVSDHGELLGAHGLYYKGIMPYEEGYRVPLIIKLPKGLGKEGIEVDELVSHMDIAPTILELTESTPLSKQAGSSLVPLLREEPVCWRESLLMQCNGVEAYVTQRIVRSDRYKFVYSPIMGDELYDLERDPFEMVNQINNPAYKDVVKEHFKLMWRLAAESEDDRIACGYSTISLAEYGPTFAWSEGEN